MSIHVGSPVYFQGREVGRVTGRQNGVYTYAIDDPEALRAASLDPTAISFTPPTERTPE